MKKYRFGTSWPEWAWNLSCQDKIILHSPEHNGPFDHSRDEEMLFFVYGKDHIEIAHWGDYLLQDDNGILSVEDS